jgi:hypothetical protein
LDTPVDIYSVDRRALTLCNEKHLEHSRARRILKMLSDSLSIPHLSAYFEPSYYVVAER